MSDGAKIVVLLLLVVVATYIASYKTAKEDGEQK
jgi:hypothetical protein